MSIVAIGLLTLWVVLYQYSDPDTHLGSLFGNAIADWSGSVSFETVNGGITLELPDDLSADVKGETVNGSIETDFPLAVKGRFSSRRLSGTIGAGGRELRLATVNGSIRLRRAGASS